MYVSRFFPLICVNIYVAGTIPLVQRKVEYLISLLEMLSSSTSYIYYSVEQKEKIKQKSLDVWKLKWP